MIEELFDKSDRKLDELMEMTRGTDQLLASLEQNAQQPHLAMEADVPADEKTRGHTKGAANIAVQTMHGDSFFANRADPDPKSSTSFGDDSTGSPALPCSRNDALVGNGAAALKPCLSTLEMCPTTVAGGLLPVGMASTATRIIYDQPTLWFCLTEGINSGNSFLYA